MASVTERVTRAVREGLRNILADVGIAERAGREELLRLLQVAGWNDEDQLFVMEAGYMGFGFIGSPLDGLSEAMMERLQAALKTRMPVDSGMQFVLWSSPDVEDVLRDYNEIRQGHPKGGLLADFRDESIAFLRGGADEPVERVNKAKLYDGRLVVTVKIKTGFSPSAEALQEIRELRDTLDGMFRHVGLRLGPLTPQRYIRFMETVMNWSDHPCWRDYREAEYDPNIFISDQILDPGVTIDARYDRVLIGRKAVRTYSPKRYPALTTFGSAARFFGDPFKGTAGLREPMLITFNLWFTDPTKEREAIDRQRTMGVFSQQRLEAKFKTQEVFGKARAVEQMVKVLNDGDRVVRGYLSYAVFADDTRDGAQASAATTAGFQALGYQMLKDGYALLPLLGNLMPFGNDIASARHTFRYKTLATAHIVPMLPLFGEWRGSGTPSITPITRTGQLMSWSLLDSNTNRNAIIAAESGAGKSFLCNELLLAELQGHGRVYVIDVGRSYEGLCRELDGDFIVFDDASNICVNPFSTIRNWEEDADILIGIVEIMAAPTVGLNDFQRSSLKQALREGVWDVHGNQGTIDHLVGYLKQQRDARLHDLATQLYSFSAKGEYGRFFNGPNTLRTGNAMTVLELGELKGRKHLQRVVLFQLLSQIQREIMLGDPAQRKLVLVDESWDLVQSSETSRYLDAFYRRFRKHNASVVMVGQSIRDFYANESAKAMWENSAHKMILSQRPESINAVRASGGLALGAVELSLVQSLSTVPGQYSEIFFSSPSGSGVGRLIVPPLRRLLYSTSPKDKTQLKKWTDAGMTPLQAAQRVLQDREAQAA